MRRADRLFQIVQILRRSRAPVRASDIAYELEVSIRTVYRDMADLMAHRTPIRGEAGTGYILEDGYDFPPLMLTVDEIEAAVMGVQWVASRGDRVQARSAQDLLTKIAAVLPARLKNSVECAPVLVPPPPHFETDRIDLEAVRTSIREGRKLEIDYINETGQDSQRVVWPVSIVYFDQVRLLAGWCERRAAFRHFRTDRIVACRFLKAAIPQTVVSLKRDWLAAEAAKRVQPPDAD